MKNNKGLIIGIIGLIIVMIGGTYAYYRWNSTSNINVSVKISGNTVTFVGGSNVTGTLTPVDSKEEGIKKDTVIAKFCVCSGCLVCPVCGDGRKW